MMRYFTPSKGGDTLIQMVTLEQVDYGYEKLCTEFICGEDAVSILQTFANHAHFRPLVNGTGEIFGFIESRTGRRVEMWDCDEQTYSEYLEEEATA